MKYIIAAVICLTVIIYATYRIAYINSDSWEQNITYNYDAVQGKTIGISGVSITQQYIDLFAIFVLLPAVVIFGMCLIIPYPRIIAR